MKFLVPILLVVNLAATSTVLALALTGKLVTAVPSLGEGGEAAGLEEAARQAFYHEFKPELVVNFPSGSRPRYMQLALTAVTYDEQALAALELHEPVIRNDLLLLFSGLDPDPLTGREGKEGMRAQALETMRSIMKARYGSEAVEDVYFSRFVMQ